MKESVRRLFARLLPILTFTLIAGCGGGGSGNTNVLSLGQGATATESIQIANPNLALNGITTVTATFLDPSGKPVSNLPVTFTTTLGSLTPASGIVTDTSGTASVQLSAGGGGSGAVTASATVAGTKLSKVVSFAVALPTITLSTPVLGISNLGPGGSTSVSVNLTDASGQPFTTPIDVIFTSDFATTGKATLTSPVRTVNGTATSLYTAAGGVGVDTIRVSVGATSVTANVTVTGVLANSISFVSASPQSIVLKGVGGVGATTSTVTFKVLDNSGKPVKGQTVDFTLNTSVGGIALTSSSAVSGADGTVSTIVQSGIVATPISVTASIHGSSPLIATQSALLVVSTGIPAQDGMSLAVATHNVEANSVDGVGDSFTVFLSDHYGNPVPDGTSVTFVAQAGQIQPFCTTANGRCSATWTSSGARTPDGRAAILAYAIGEESFADPNGNGVADGPSVLTCLANGSLQDSVTCGEFTDTTQAWRDDAHTGFYVPVNTVVKSFPNFPGDFFVDFDNSHKVDRDGIFNGILRPVDVTGPRTKHVFENNVIVLSTSSAKINDFDKTALTPGTLNNGVVISGATTLSGSVQDTNTHLVNPMASGTQIAISSQSICLTATPSSFTVPNTTIGPTGFDTVISNSCLAGIGSPGTMTVTVTSPSGIQTSRSFSFTW